MSKKTAVKSAIGGMSLASLLATAQMLNAQAPAPYGAPISLENAKKAAAPALAEAVKNHWNMAVAVVDPSGNLVYYEKMDDTQLGSAKVAIDKARSAALFKRPTKVFQDTLAAGGRSKVAFRWSSKERLSVPSGFQAARARRTASAPRPAPTP